MFENLWNRKTAAVEAGGIIIERSQGDPLQFDGELRVESNGSAWPDYRPAEPHHVLRVYDVATGDFAVIVEFWLSATDSIVDGELVTSVDELDDFFCIQAADHFMQLGSVSARQEQDLEQRLLARYDQQVLDVLTACGLKSKTHPRMAAGRSNYRGWSTSPAADASPDGDDG